MKDMNSKTMMKLRVDLEKLSRACQIDFDGLKKSHQSYLKNMIQKKLLEMALEVNNSAVEEPVCN